MGHKVHPLGFRIGVVRDWQAKWYAEKNFSEFVLEDLKLRQAIQVKYPDAGISQVEISRQANEVFITIYTSRPGVVIGRGGQRVDETRLHLEKITGRRVRLNIMEVQQPELDAALVAKTVAEQMARRVAYRRAVKQAISRTIQAGAKGVRIRVAGRLGGAEIARSQTLHDGQVPLHTLRADIDYGFTEAHTTFGRIGVKVWIYKGEILPERELEEAEVEVEPSAAAELEGAPAMAEVKGAVAEVGQEALPEKMPAVAESGEEVGEAMPAAELEEKPAEPEMEKAELEMAPKAEAEAAELEEKPAAPEMEKAAEAVPAETPEKKPAKPRVRRAKAAPAAEVEKVAPKAKSAPMDAEAAKAEPPLTEGEDKKDVTAEAGEAPQDA